MTETFTTKKSRGDILKESREDQGLSLEDVHEVTKIPLDVLRAIEEGYTIRTLSAFYLKGFIKMYAKYLAVDINDVLDDYHEEKLPEPIINENPMDKIEKRIHQFFTRERQQQMIKIAGIIMVLFIIGRVAGCVAGQRRERLNLQELKKNKTADLVAASAAQLPTDSSEENKRLPRTAINPKPPVVKPAAAPAISAAVVSEAKKPVAVVKNVNLTVKSKERGWLQVKVDGNVVFQSTFKQGTAETWQADEKIEISGKIIHSLDYEVNGKLLGSLGRADRNARRVVITRNGLTVKK